MKPHFGNHWSIPCGLAVVVLVFLTLIKYFEVSAMIGKKLKWTLKKCCERKFKPCKLGKESSEVVEMIKTLSRVQMKMSEIY